MIGEWEGLLISAVATIVGIIVTVLYVGNKAVKRRNESERNED